MCNGPQYDIHWMVNNEKVDIMYVQWSPVWYTLDGKQWKSLHNVCAMVAVHLNES
jgi:hypothetical protein